MASHLGGAGLKPENWVFEHYYEFAEKMSSVLQAALEGKSRIPRQTPLAEAWLGLSLFYGESSLPLYEIIHIADGISHAIPNPDEVAWTFLRLRMRGWLLVEGDLYGLTPEGRREIGAVVGGGTVLKRLERLKEWISMNPPPGDK